MAHLIANPTGGRIVQLPSGKILTGTNAANYGKTPVTSPTPNPVVTTTPPPTTSTSPVVKTSGTTQTNPQLDQNSQDAQDFHKANPGLEYTPEDKQQADQADKIQTAQNSLDDVNKQLDDAFETFNNTMNQYANGAVPLTTGEQAQVNGLTQQYQSLIDQQKQVNTGATGSAQVRGYQTGAAEYDPTFQAKTINTIASTGIAKVAALSTQMASAVADLTEKFKTNDMAAIKSAWDEYQGYKDDKAKALQDTIDKTQSAIKDAQDAQQKILDGVNAVAEEALKNGADQKTVAAITGAGSVSEALAAAGDYMQQGTGQVGDYLQYKRDTLQKGLTPLDYGSWKASDDARQSKLDSSKAYNSAYASAAGKAAADAKFGTGGDSSTQNLAQQLVTGQLAPSELSKRSTGTASYNAILKAADDYSMSTTGKHFNIAQADRDYKFANNPQTQNTLNYVTSLTGTDDGSGNLVGGNLSELKNISDSIDRTSFPALNNAKAWAKLSTGSSDIAQYQAVATEVADQVAKILQGGTGGTSDAKLQQATNLFNTGFSKDQLNAVITSLGPLLQNRAKSMISDNPYLSDYADNLGISTTIQSPQKQVNSYIQANPDKAESIAKLYEVPGATDQDVLDYINLQK